jgi:cell division protein ZipA
MAQRREPTFAEDIEPEIPAPGEPRVEEAPVPQAQKIVAVRVTARPPERFGGTQLLDALHAEGLEFGRYEIFHRLDPVGHPIFSMASLVEPGTFDPKTMNECAYPGIALFAVLPGPVSARQAFEELLSTAHSLAGRLGGGLQDDRGAPLSMNRITAMHEEMLEFDRAHHARPGR